MKSVDDDHLLTNEQRVSLEKIVYRLTQPPLDHTLIEHKIAKDDIVRLILEKPWRRTAVSNETCLDIEDKVSLAVRSGRPIEFSVPFGGYKSWRLPAFPHVDWAEIFWIDYLRSFAERISSLYAPGVVFYLTYVGGVLGWVNNLPDNAQQIYISELAILIARRSSQKVSFTLVDHSDAYGGADAVLKLLEERETIIEAPGPSELESARRNLLPAQGMEPGMAFSDADVERAARRCLAMMSLERRREFNKYGPRIQLTHIKAGGKSLHIGSCRSAVSQPWVSEGYLEWRPQKYWIERLITTQQIRPSSHLFQLFHGLRDVSPHLHSLQLILPMTPEPQA